MGKGFGRFYGIGTTTGEPGSYLPIADTVGDAVALDAIGMMAAAVDTPPEGGTRFTVSFPATTPAF